MIRYLFHDSKGFFQGRAWVIPAAETQGWVYPYAVIVDLNDGRNDLFGCHYQNEIHHRLEFWARKAGRDVEVKPFPSSPLIEEIERCRRLPIPR